MQMGQFIDHDFAHSPNNDASTCCSRGEKSEECIEISMPPDDPFFGKGRGKHGTGGRESCMPLARAMTSPTINCELDGERQQVILF